MNLFYIKIHYLNLFLFSYLFFNKNYFENSGMVDEYLTKLNSKQFNDLLKSPNVDYNNYGTEISTYTNNFKSPLKKLSQNIFVMPSSRKMECKTSIDLSKKMKIKQSSKIFLSLSENANDSKISSDQMDSDNDSEISEDQLNNNTIVSRPKQEKDILINSVNEKSEKDIIFEDYYKKFYMPSCDNVTGCYDLYVTNCLKMISVFDPQYSFDSKVFEIKESINKSLNFTNKPLLILDLDETLIHSDLECKFVAHDEYIETESGIIPINIRPNLYEFLDFCALHFDLVIYTASCSDYADPILDYIEKNKKYFMKRFYREHCICYRNLYLKDLSIFNKPLNQILIVDNCIFSFAYYLSNGVLITSFYNDVEDLDLLSLIEFFKSSILNTPDVRVELEATFEFKKIYNNLINVNI
jgi:Dullard-like phosphatase family protein